MTLKKGEVAAADRTDPLTLDGSSYDVNKLLHGLSLKGKTREEAIREADNLPDVNTTGTHGLAATKGGTVDLASPKVVEAGNAGVAEFSHTKGVAEDGGEVKAKSEGR